MTESDFVLTVIALVVSLAACGFLWVQNKELRHKKELAEYLLEEAKSELEKEHARCETIKVALELVEREVKKLKAQVAETDDPTWKRLEFVTTVVKPVPMCAECIIPREWLNGNNLDELVAEAVDALFKEMSSEISKYAEITTQFDIEEMTKRIRVKLMVVPQK